LARIDDADYVFAGPGSPTYALGVWENSRLRDVLVDKLTHGGCVAFSSAAAATLGVATVPVYEIYKVGAAPRWAQGMDLLAQLGLRAAVIPHYDNAEGGTHDTRYSYLGERRLELMEEQLPDDVFVLGVDEHTACILDLDADTAAVTGLGAVTVRRRGGSSRFESGSTVPLQRWRDGDGDVESGATNGSSRQGTPKEHADAPRSLPFVAEVASGARRFDEALASGDARGAVEAVLQLEELMTAWANETFSADEADQARAALRSMVTRLGEAATDGLRGPKTTVAPYVEALLEARERARDAKRFDEADVIRDRLVAEGIEIRDNPEGTDWELNAEK
jgi:hypothetical protein